MQNNHSGQQKKTEPVDRSRWHYYISCTWWKSWRNFLANDSKSSNSMFPGKTFCPYDLSLAQHNFFFIVELPYFLIIHRYYDKYWWVHPNVYLFCMICGERGCPGSEFLSSILYVVLVALLMGGLSTMSALSTPNGWRDLSRGRFIIFTPFNIFYIESPSTQQGLRRVQKWRMSNFVEVAVGGGTYMQCWQLRSLHIKKSLIGTLIGTHIFKNRYQIGTTGLKNRDLLCN